MAAKIFIASKLLPVPGSKYHSYLVFDADGDPATTNDKQVIRGGDVWSTNIWVEAGKDIASSA